MQAYEPNYQKISKIGISKIVFENAIDETYVTLFGYKPVANNEKLIECDYCCEFSILTDLLLTTYDYTERLIDVIINAIQNSPHDALIEIEVEEIYNAPLVIENIELMMYRPFEKNENGEFHEVPKSEEFYIIDSVTLSWEMRNKELVMLHQELVEELKLLHLSYIYYLRLIENGLTQGKARKISGLKNELLFRIATTNFKIFDYKSVTK